MKELYRKTNNKFMTDFQIVSRTQVELAIEIRAYRCKHKLSQRQVAHIATVYGIPYKVKFSQTEISFYERFQTIPSEKKMNALLDMLGVTVEVLNERN